MLVEMMHNYVLILGIQVSESLDCSGEAIIVYHDVKEGPEKTKVEMERINMNREYLI